MVLRREALELQRREQAVAHGGIEMRQDRLAGRRGVGRRPAAHAVGEADGLHRLALVDVEDLARLAGWRAARPRPSCPRRRSSSGSAAPRRSKSFQTRCAISNRRTPSR